MDVTTQCEMGFKTHVIVATWAASKQAEGSMTDFSMYQGSSIRLLFSPNPI